MVPTNIKHIRRELASLRSEVRRARIVKMADMRMTITPNGTYLRPLIPPQTQQTTGSGYVAVWL